MGQGLLEARGLGDVAQPPVDLAGGLLEEDVQVSGDGEPKTGSKVNWVEQEDPK